MAKDKNLLAPKVIKTKCGYSSTFFTDSKGYKRSIMLLSWIPGRIWNQVNPHTENLRYELGFICGTLSKFLNDFDHDFAHRTFEWDIANGLWTKEYLNLFHDIIDKFHFWDELNKEQKEKIIENYTSNSENTSFLLDYFENFLISLKKNTLNSFIKSVIKS